MTDGPAAILIAIISHPAIELPFFCIYHPFMKELQASEPSKSGWLRNARQAVQANAFFRGMAGSFALISLFSETVSLENYETARAINAVIIGWDRIAASIGLALGNLPFVPQLDATLINVFIFLASVTIPSLFGGVEIMRPIWDNSNKQEWFIARVLPPILMACISYIFIFGPLLFFTGNFEFLKQSHPEGLPGSGLMSFASQLHYLSFVFLSLVMPFVFALFVKPYRLGVLLIAGTLLTVQVLYHAPMVGDRIQTFTDLMHSAE